MGAALRFWVNGQLFRSIIFFIIFFPGSSFILFLDRSANRIITMESNLKRVIVDYKKLTPEVLKLLVEKYPDGYGDNDVISFRNLKGELIEAVEVSTEDAKYLVKISSKLERSMANFDDDGEEDDDFDAVALDKLPEEGEDFPEDADDSEEE